MMHNLLRRLLGMIMVATGLFFFSAIGLAATAPAPSVPEEEVCIPKDVEARVMACPQGANKFRVVARAKVGTTTRVEKEKKKTEAGPTLEREYTRQVTESAFKRKRQKKSIDILRKELKLLKGLAASTPNDNPEKADVLKRIADAYKDFYDQINFMARDLDEKIFVAKNNEDKKLAAKYKAQQKALDEKAQQYRELAIRAYVEIRNTFPDYPDYDEILFAIAYEIDQLAAEQEDEGKKSSYRARAREFYRELIRKYPRSRFIPHSWMAFGEYYFHEERVVDKALRSYEKVIEWGVEGNPNYAIAQYYIAWCYYNMQEYQRTIDQFNTVIKFAKANPENREAKAVAKRARLELVDPFSKIGNPSQAWRYFRKVGGNLAHKMLVRLANLYYDEGQWDDSILIFHKLEALEIENHRNNNGDDLCEYQSMITQAVINSKSKRRQLEELKRQLALYKKFAGEKHDPAKIQKCASTTTAVAWDQATHWHVEAVGSESSPGTKNRTTMEVTVGLYDAILKTFPNLDELEIEGFDEKTKPTNYRVAYYKADLYWTMEQWDKCGPAFDAVVELDPTGDLTPEAAYGAVLCYNKSYVKLRGALDTSRNEDIQESTEGTSCNAACKKCKKRCKGRGEKKAKCISKCEVQKKPVLKARTLTDFEKGIIKSYDRYVCYVSEGEDLINIKYRRARIYYEANMFAEAGVLFKEIAMAHSDSELGVYAANLYLDCLNALGDMVGQPNPACYDELAATVDVFIDTKKAPGKHLMMDGEFAIQLKSLKIGVLRKKAETLSKRERFKESAEVYLSIYRNYRDAYDDRGMCEVLFNTAINMEAARLVMPAIQVRQKMIELYPDCEYSKKAAYYIGQNYHALQVFNLAADNYKDFANKYAGEKEAPVALSNAVMFYIGLGDYENAWSAVKLFQTSYKSKRPAEAATVFFSAGYIYINEALETDRDTAWEEVRKHYLSYIKRYRKVKAVDEIVQAYVFIADSWWNQRKPDFGQAEKLYRKAFSTFGKNAMDKVTENKRKAAMLNAAAKARFQLAELNYREFKRIKFPEFAPERKLPRQVETWHKKKIGKKGVKKEEEIRKYRRLLVRWGEMTRAEAKKENRKEIASVQFNYWLEKKFKPWMDTKSKALTAANTDFIKVVNMHVPEWEMAAAARAGDMQLDFMNALYDAPLPPMFKDDEELKTIYRQSMDEKAEPFRKAATNAFAHCLNVSTKVRWFNENSVRCESELNKLDPRQYPVSEEIRVQPNNEYSYWAIPEAVLELESAAKRRDRELATSADSMGAKVGKE